MDQVQQSVDGFELVALIAEGIQPVHRRKFPAHCLAWPSLQQVGNFVQSLLGDQREIRAFWQTLTQYYRAARGFAGPQSKF